MNAKQKKSLVVLAGLVVVLIVLFVAVLLTNRHKQDAAGSADSSAEQVTDSGSSYSALTYNNGTATLSFVKNADGTWSWADDPDFPLDQNYPSMIANTISGLTPQQTITDGDTLDAYGLDSPAITLTATLEDGTQTTFALGNQVVGNTSAYYMLLNGDESTVYIIADSLHSALSYGIYDMMTLPEIPVLTSDQISSIQVDGAVSTSLISTVETAAASGDSSASSSADSSASVTWTSGGADVTASDSVSSLVGELTAAALDSCKDYKPTDKAVSLCGFDAPAATVTVNYTGDDGSEKSYTLIVGGTTTDGKSRYVRLNDDLTIYAMSSDNLSAVLSVAQSGLGA